MNFNSQTILRGASAALLICVICSCGNSGQRSNSISKTSYSFKQDGSRIIVTQSDYSRHAINLSLLGKQHQVVSYGKVDTLDIFKIADHFELAYSLAEKGRASVSLNVDGAHDTTFTYVSNPTSTASHYAKITAGAAARLSTEANSVERTDVIKWLYSSGNKLDDGSIAKMVATINSMSAENNTYWVNDGVAIPVIKSFAGQKYSVNTNISADYFYLFATDSAEDVEDFIAEVVSQDFTNAKKTPNAMDCFRPKDKGGYLTIFLIGLNKDWTREVIPVGLVGVDAISPYVSSDNNNLDNLLLSRRATATDSNNMVFNLKSQRVVIKIKKSDSKESLTGTLNISTGEFRGDNANFIFRFGGDIESVSIKREIHHDYQRYFMRPETKTIKLSDKNSPYHFTYTVDLGIGDNYIPIKVTDKRGNTTDYTYHIKMVQGENNNPEVNIDNNINIW